MKKLFLFSATSFFAIIANCCTVTTSVHNTTCYNSCNGSATATAVGVPSFTYSWAPSGQTTQTAIGLCRGTYTVTITDALGCHASATAQVNSTYPDIIIITQAQPACHGTCSGGAAAQGAGGVGNFTYLWSPGGQTTQTISNQCPGTYTCTVTDGVGCTKSTTVTIVQSTSIGPNPSHTNVPCFSSCNGTASVSPTGGISPYSYSWSPGGQTTASITGQCAGTYTCTVTDANGCTGAAQITITSPTQLGVSVSSTPPTCHGSCNGSLQSSVSGGIAPYSYSWSPGGQTTANISSQCAGDYTLTITDANGCTTSVQVTLTSPAQLNISISPTPTTCNLCNGSLQSSVSEGVTPYSYSWSPGGATTANINDLCAGDYSLTVTDANGCTASSSITLSNSDPAGSLDNTFSDDGKQTTAIGNGEDWAFSIALQTDGKIIVAGSSYNGSNKDFAVVRYNSDGSLDNTFGGGGKVTTSIAGSDDVGRSVAVQSDGKIVVAGYSLGWGFAVVRYNSDGSLDNTFNGNGIVTTIIGDQNWAYAMALQPDGKIVVAGGAYFGTNQDFAVVRYNSDGSLDNTFDNDGVVTTGIGNGDDISSGIVVQTDGKIVAGGITYNGTNWDFAAARYNSDGSLDNTFDENGTVTTSVGGSDDIWASVALQSDKKIIVAGSVVEAGGGNHDFAAVRYNSDGSLDNTFDGDGKVTTPVGNSNDVSRAVTIHPDGKIVLAGWSFSPYPVEQDEFALVRYNSDGSLDNSFDEDGKVTTPIGNSNDKCFAVAVQADDKIVAAGFSDNGADFDFAVVRYGSCSERRPVANGSGMTQSTSWTTSVDIYPNPTSGSVNIRSDMVISEIEIINVLGEKVFASRTTEAQPEKGFSIDLSSQAKGIYLIQVKTGTQTTIQKLVIQ